MTPAERCAVRLLAGEAGKAMPVVVVEGDAPPRATGELAHHVDHAGKRIPVKISRFFKKREWATLTTFVRSTRRVEVGAAWLEAWRSSGGLAEVNRARDATKRLTPRRTG